MTFKFRYFEKIVGFFVLLGLLLLLITVIFMAGEQKWFDSSLELHTRFKSGEELSKGMDIKINGLTVGKVSKISFAPNNEIDVSFKVYNEFRNKIRKNSYVYKGGLSFLGGGFLSLMLGSEEKRLKEEGASKLAEDGDFLLSTEEAIERKYIDPGDVNEDLMGSVAAIPQSVNLLIKQLANPQGPLMGLLHNLDTITGNVAGGKGPVGALLSDSTLNSYLSATLANMQKVTDDISVLSALLRKSSPNITSIIDSADRSLSEASRILASLQNYLGGTSGGGGESINSARLLQHNQRSERY
jgi:phospholipid/cholesterol/gamma-HCH transport system substrate-binding protein